MGLRTKIFLPILLASLLLAAYMAAIWTPRWLTGMEAIYQESEQRHLESVAEGLVPLLLGNQLDVIYGTLDSLLHKNKNWVDIQLFDQQGRLLYPLEAKTLPPALASHQIRTLSQEISYGGTRLGRLDVKVDLTRQFSGINAWRANLTTMLLVVALLFLLSTVAVLEQVVRKPLRALSAAAKQLADGDYTAPLPLPKNDEVGVLVESFAAMRDAIGSHAERLQEQKYALEILNDTLEQRVQERTAQLTEKNAEVLKASEDLKAVQWRLLQQDKLASIGQLAAGVAHEINNPMGYIASNLRVLAEYFDQLVQFDRIRGELGDNELTPATRDAIAGNRTALEIDFLLEDGVDLIRESLGGASRVTKIVLDLKNFSRVDMMLESEPVDLAACMESALNVCYNDLKYKADIKKEFQPAPAVVCNSGHLNQVFLNLLVNAGQAISGQGEIVLSCRHDDSFVYASISDNGCGIPEEAVQRIFDPFFTTKEVGEGTGLGLSISAELVRQYNGELLVESRVGEGTTFTVKLPWSSST